MRDEFLLSAVAHGDGHIALQSSVSGAFYRRIAKCPAKGFFIHFRQPGKVRMKRLYLRLKFRRLRERRVAGFVVPGTNVLADVAAKDVMSDRLAKFPRNVAALLDGQISNATPGIEFARGHNGLRGTSVNAACAASATISGGKIGRQVEGRENHAQK